MATVNASYMTLADRAQAEHKDGGTATVVEMMSRSSPFLATAPSIPCNEGKQHLTVQRTGLPQGTWTALYEGVQPEKSRRSQVKDSTAMLEGESAIDSRLLDLVKDPAMARLDESAAFIEGMSQTMETAIVYSDLSNPKKFLGLSPRFSSSSAQNGAQLVNAGGSQSDNMSVWFITWAPQVCTLIYPEGVDELAMGVKRKDKGEHRVNDANGNPYYQMIDHFTFHNGVSVPDWRYVVRICNIDYSSLIAGSSTASILGWMRSAYFKLRARGYVGGDNQHLGNIVNGKTCIYAHRDFIEWYEAALTAAGQEVKPMEVSQGFYQAASSYRGIPIYECDALLTTEAAISFS
ncbi:MAG: major capsid protein [Pseudomonadota bacterium]